MKYPKSFFPALLVFLLSLSACNGQDGGVAAIGGSAGPAPVGTDAAAPGAPTAPSDPGIPSDPAAPAPRPYATAALLFVGSGTWSPEIASIKNILAANGATYDTATSAQLNAMSLDEISAYGTLIFPGGSGGTQAGSLSSATHAKLRAAVQERGVSYIGFCAGAFIAQAPAPAPGGDVSYGLGVVDGPVLDYYYLEYQGTPVAMTMHTFADGSQANILWYGGPVTSEVPGGVVARYPDGNPAITQVWSGNGFVIMVGGHPTATQSMMGSLGVSSSQGPRTDIAWKLINAAINRAPLPAF